MSTEQQWLDSLTDADKDQLLVDAYFKKSIADTAGAHAEDAIKALKHHGVEVWSERPEDDMVVMITFGTLRKLIAPPVPSVADAAGASECIAKYCPCAPGKCAVGMIDSRAKESDK